MRECASDVRFWRDETMIKRYDIYEAWNGSMNIECLPRTGEWVTYEDHAKEIATLRAENNRLKDEAYNARQSAKGENALRLRADDDHAEGIADLRALAREAVKEAYAEAFDDAWDLARGLDADDDLIQECWLKSGAECDFKEGKA
jgi:hypothetical protein